MAIVFKAGKEYVLDTWRFGMVRGVVVGSDPEFVRVRLTAVMRGESRSYQPGEVKGFRISQIKAGRGV